MTNKALRILIADQCHAQLLSIEKLLNRLDYYRIAPIRTFEELSSLTKGSYEAFDLLIVNKTLASSCSIGLDKFCRERQKIRHSLIYRDPAVPPALRLDCQGKSIYASMAGVPAIGELSILLNLIDPPSRWACFKALQWLGGRAALNQ